MGNKYSSEGGGQHVVAPSEVGRGRSWSFHGVASRSARLSRTGGDVTTRTRRSSLSDAIKNSNHDHHNNNDRESRKLDAGIATQSAAVAVPARVVSGEARVTQGAASCPAVIFEKPGLPPLHHSVFGSAREKRRGDRNCALVLGESVRRECVRGGGEKRLSALTEETSACAGDAVQADLLVAADSGRGQVKVGGASQAGSPSPVGVTAATLVGSATAIALTRTARATVDESEVVHSTPGHNGSKRTGSTCLAPSAGPFTLAVLDETGQPKREGDRGGSTQEPKNRDVVLSNAKLTDWNLGVDVMLGDDGGLWKEPASGDGPHTTDSGYNTVSRGLDSSFTSNTPGLTITTDDNKHVNVWSEMDGDARAGRMRESEMIPAFSSMSLAEVRQVSEALYGDKLLLDLVRRRGLASLNRDLSLSHNSMMAALAVEGVEMADTARSASLQSFLAPQHEMKQNVNEWHDDSFTSRDHRPDDQFSYQEFQEEGDPYFGEFRPRSSSSTFAELNSRTRARIAMGMAGARMRKSCAGGGGTSSNETFGLCPVGRGSELARPREPFTYSANSQEVVEAQKLLAKRALGDYSPSPESSMGREEGDSGRSPSSVSRAMDVPQRRHHLTSRPPVHSLSTSAPMTSALSHPTPSLRQLRPLPEIHEHAPFLSCSVPASGGFLHHPPPSLRSGDDALRDEDEWPVTSRERSSSFSAFGRNLPAFPPGGASSTGVNGDAAVHLTDGHRWKSPSLAAVPAAGVGVGQGSDKSGAMPRRRGRGDGGGGEMPEPRPLGPSDRSWSYSVTSLADQTMVRSEAWKKDFCSIRDRPGENGICFLLFHHQ
ncbi:hypothetical protein C0Q70_03048 [Pomacea canaliculata]|uniref:Uncharacterized protein n=1 Tax=Pomacea canaliculata TaxID=400727 RepID=A0A2T7PRN1_POMCA|nr:hypothetical protein C0Q70_03048 [Pomacea canaliculata]